MNKFFSSSVGTVHIVCFKPKIVRNYIRRSYGTRKKSLNLGPVIKITGYKIDRAYGSMRYQQTYG